MSLSRETTMRQAEIWDQLSGKGPFLVASRSWPLDDGTEADAIHVIINPDEDSKKVFVVLHPGTKQERKAQVVESEGEPRLLEEEVEFPFQ